MFLLNIALYKYIDVKGTKKVGWHYLGRFVFNGEESVGRITYDLDGLVTN